MIVERHLKSTLLKRLQPGKVIVLVGARRVGKTFLIKQIINEFPAKPLFLNGEDFEVQDILKRRTVQNYKNLLGNKKLLIIDEAQKVPEVGLILKLIVDSIDGIKILISGSSAFDISSVTGEPLTGRKETFQLFPLCESEYSNIESIVERKDNLQVRLIYGNYPQLVNIANNTDKAVYLRELVNSYLLKDILEFEKVKSSSKILNLLKLVAFQIGKPVSYQELGRQLSMSKNTVERYLNLLSKVYVLYKLNGFSRNLRKEITKNTKWYFLDNGIRNAIVANFNNLESRDDVGLLWENYIISERIKYQNYSRMISNNYFWRTYDQQEIDWIEERGGKLFGYEFKWRESKAKIPPSWEKAYPDAGFKLITSSNYMDWIKLS